MMICKVEAETDGVAGLNSSTLYLKKVTNELVLGQGEIRMSKDILEWQVARVTSTGWNGAHKHEWAIIPGLSFLSPRIWFSPNVWGYCDSGSLTLWSSHSSQKDQMELSLRQSAIKACACKCVKVFTFLDFVVLLPCWTLFIYFCCNCCYKTYNTVYLCSTKWLR